MRPVTNEALSPSQLRAYYEEQGRSAIGEGSMINCSEKPNVDIVIKMATEHLDHFQRVIDVGCGANLVCDQILARRGKEVVGVDFSFSFLKLTPPNSGTSLIQADAVNLPFSNDSFDAVICSETLEHIPDEKAVIKELARILRPEGWLFFTVPNLWNAARIIGMIKSLSPRLRLMPGHLREYSSKKVSHLLRENFEVKKKYPVGFGWAGSPVGGWIEKLIETGILSRFSKSVAVTARKR